MSIYSLGLNINPSDLASLINAKEQIVLVRRLTDAGFPVAWGVISLLQSNVVTWNDDYQVFAAATPATVGRILVMNTATNATLQSDYDYSPSGFSGPSPDGSLPPGTVQIRNTDSNTNTFGFAQGYMRNGSSVTSIPVSAQPVPGRQLVRFSASQSLWVYLSSGVQSGMVVNPPVTSSMSRQVFSAALLLDFSNGNTSQSVIYSSELGQFIVSK